MELLIKTKYTKTSKCVDLQGIGTKYISINIYIYIYVYIYI